MQATAKNLRALKEMRDTTQSAIAAVAGVTDGAMSSWFNGDRTPRHKYLARIADYYKVTVDDLVSDSGGLYAKLHGLENAPNGATAISCASCRMVPVRVLGTTFAGSPDEPIEYDGDAMLYEDMAARHPRCFALEVSGSCMDKVFTESDYIYVDPDMEPRDGSIAVMLIDGKSETRRVKLGVGSMMLVSESHDPQPDIIIRAGDGQEACCQGVVFWWQARSELF